WNGSTAFFSASCCFRAICFWYLEASAPRMDFFMAASPLLWTGDRRRQCSRYSATELFTGCVVNAETVTCGLIARMDPDSTCASPRSQKHELPGSGSGLPFSALCTVWLNSLEFTIKGETRSSLPPPRTGRKV